MRVERNKRSKPFRNTTRTQYVGVPYDYREKFLVQPVLNRQLVSFQANKSKRAYRWYKYKEAFSASLVEYLLCQYGRISGEVLDPFAGSGTALFAASAAGIDADGIELLPIGQRINPQWTAALAAADREELLQAILEYLEEQKNRGKLNNNGIPRMVRGYFYEMACVIAECHRVLMPGGCYSW